MPFKVTPFCMTRALLTAQPMAMMAREKNHTVYCKDHYEERQTIESGANNPEDACEHAWNVFQNIDENWQTPDVGRSLMVGDMVRVTDEAGNSSWWICCSMGWTETKEPSEDTIQTFIK